MKVCVGFCSLWTGNSAFWKQKYGKEWKLSWISVVYRLWPLRREHYWVPVFPDSCDSFSVCLQWHDHYNQGQIINCEPWGGGEACVFLANLLGFRNSIDLIGSFHEWISAVLWKLLQISMWLQGKWNFPPTPLACFKAKFFRLFISNHNRRSATETALRGQTEELKLQVLCWYCGWSTVVFVGKRIFLILI